MRDRDYYREDDRTALYFLMAWLGLLAAIPIAVAVCVGWFFA